MKIGSALPLITSSQLKNPNADDETAKGGHNLNSVRSSGRGMGAQNLARGLNNAPRGLGETDNSGRASQKEKRVNGLKDSDAEKARGLGYEKTRGLGNQKEQDPKIEREVRALKANEQRVRSHEMAHKSAGGSLAGSATYQYTVGPDGKRYVVGGEVSISMPSGKDAEETIRNMEKVRSAALAPSDPSPQDISVAQKASAIAQQARAELRREKAEETAVVADEAMEPGPKKDLPSISTYA